MIQAEVEALDSSALVARVERLASADDEPLPTRYAYWTAARQKRREILERQAARGATGVAAQVTALDEPLEALRDNLFSAEDERRTTDIKADRQAVEGLLERAYVSRHGVDDVVQAHAVQNQTIHQRDNLPTAPNPEPAGSPTGSPKA